MPSQEVMPQWVCSHGTNDQIMPTINRQWTRQFHDQCWKQGVENVSRTSSLINYRILMHFTGSYKHCYLQEPKHVTSNSQSVVQQTQCLFVFFDPSGTSPRHCEK